MKDKSYVLTIVIGFSIILLIGLTFAYFNYTKNINADSNNLIITDKNINLNLNTLNNENKISDIIDNNNFDYNNNFNSDSNNTDVTDLNTIVEIPKDSSNAGSGEGYPNNNSNNNNQNNETINLVVANITSNTITIINVINHIFVVPLILNIL